jgi:hypothetical protein
MADKVDSNITGLRFAEEASLKVLPGSPVWYPLEPNSYSDFGGQLATIARNPINPSRQRKKGVITDLDASGGFNQDLTFNNSTRVLQGFFFANAREKATTQALNTAAVVITGILAANDDYTAAAGLPTTIIPGDLVYASGFGVTANNGLKTSNAISTGIAISVSDSLADEAVPPAAAKVELVGHQFASADVSIAMNGTLPQLVSSAVTMTTLPLIPGEWVYIGDEVAGNVFVNNQGYARIKRITATFIEFDKTTWTPQAEAGTGKTIRIYYGSVIKNEPLPADIIRRTYNVERTLGVDVNGTMSEYLVGAVANELTVNVEQADKVTIDLTFIACDNEQRNGLTGVKAGTRPTLVSEDAYNTSSDFARIKLAVVTDDTDVLPLFAFATQLTLSVNNNVTPNKAIGVLGAFDTSAGTFEVGGNITAYFASIDAVQSVRNNADITLDIILAKDQKAIIIDIPLLSLGDGRLAVEQDQAIQLPLETNAAESSFGHTLLFQSFPYLPTTAI